MATDTELRRRVTRLENEVVSIYELLSEVQATQREHTQLFVAIDQRLDGIDGRLDGIDGRLGVIETTLTEVLRRLPEPA